ncbi:unnamed protein product [Meloidogyne enterolobii]|uniref:Uncharacterized protein n=1 Tax=Meloidogyne enterolobii TaxID=390850 RepID=A0ACB0YN78_MELEN
MYVLMEHSGRLHSPPPDRRHHHHPKAVLRARAHKHQSPPPLEGQQQQQQKSPLKNVKCQSLDNEILKEREEEEDISKFKQFVSKIAEENKKQQQQQKHLANERKLSTPTTSKHLNKHAQQNNLPACFASSFASTLNNANNTNDYSQLPPPIRYRFHPHLLAKEEKHPPYQWKENNFINNSMLLNNNSQQCFIPRSTQLINRQVMLHGNNKVGPINEVYEEVKQLKSDGKVKQQEELFQNKEDSKIEAKKLKQEIKILKELKLKQEKDVKQNKKQDKNLKQYERLEKDDNLVNLDQNEMKNNEKQNIKVKKNKKDLKQEVKQEEELKQNLKQNMEMKQNNNNMKQGVELLENFKKDKKEDLKQEEKSKQNIRQELKRKLKQEVKQEIDQDKDSSNFSSNMKQQKKRLSIQTNYQNSLRRSLSQSRCCSSSITSNNQQQQKADNFLKFMSRSKTSTNLATNLASNRSRESSISSLSWHRLIRGKSPKNNINNNNSSSYYSPKILNKTKNKNNNFDAFLNIFNATENLKFVEKCWERKNNNNNLSSNNQKLEENSFIRVQRELKCIEERRALILGRRKGYRKNICVADLIGVENLLLNKKLLKEQEQQINNETDYLILQKPKQRELEEYYNDDDAELEVMANIVDANAPRPSGQLITPCRADFPGCATPPPLPRSIETAPHKWANTQPKAIAAVQLDANNNSSKPSNNLTYAKLLSRAVKIAYTLLNKIVVIPSTSGSGGKERVHLCLPGDRVALVYPNNEAPAFLCAFYGCLLAGVVPVPIEVPTAKRSDTAGIQQFGFLLGSCGL